LAESSAPARSVARFTAAVNRGLRESAIIALGIVALVLLLALATYSPDDPGFSFTGNATPVHNRIGVVGAWLADVLFFLFGRPAFLFPLVLAAACWGLQRRLRQGSASRANTVVRIAGFLLVLVASCALATLHWAPGVLRQSAGGVVGSVVGRGLAAGLEFLGATLLLIAAWMAGLSLAFGVSWLTIMDRLGNSVWAGVGWLRARWSSSRDAAEGRERRQARKEAVESLQKKAVARPPPRIEAPAPLMEKSARVERERQVPLFDPPKASELPALKLLDDPPPREPL
jgi:S-DNA-T family DNA segregation ATPase FtsK/SpoIIIE